MTQLPMTQQEKKLLEALKSSWRTHKQALLLQQISSPRIKKMVECSNKR